MDPQHPVLAGRGIGGTAGVVAGRGATAASPVIVDLPLRGGWTAVRTPADKVPSHGTDALGQRFAYDLVRQDGRGRSHPDGALRAGLVGVPTDRFFGWGQPVYAAADGTVVEVVDTVAERPRVRPPVEGLAAARASIEFEPTSAGVDRVPGNRVVVEGRASVALYAHLAPGPSPVAVGDQVGVGDLLGRVGHTGNSTAPHLHFQLMAGTDPLVAAGVPCAFAEYDAQVAGRWVRVNGGMPGPREPIRSVR